MLISAVTYFIISISGLIGSGIAWEEILKATSNPDQNLDDTTVTNHAE